MPQWRHDSEYSRRGQRLALGALVKSATPFVVALLAAIGFAWLAAADPKLDDVAVVRDTHGRTVLLYPEPVHPLLLDLKSLEEQPFEFGGRDGAIG
jgi:hypothetical protein